MTEIQVQHKPGGLTDKQKLELGDDIVNKYIAEAETMDSAMAEATSWLLEEKGFDRVEWAQIGSDDILLCLLWRYREGIMDEFILEFSGYDEINVSLFCFGGDISL